MLLLSEMVTVTGNRFCFRTLVEERTFSPKLPGSSQRTAEAWSVLSAGQLREGAEWQKQLPEEDDQPQTFGQLALAQTHVRM